MGLGREEDIMQIRSGIPRTFALAAILLCGTAISGVAQASVDTRATVEAIPSGKIITPGSSIETPEDIGHRAHTNIGIFVPNGKASPNSTTPTGAGDTPASLACIYKLVAVTPGCDPVTLTQTAKGGSKLVVIVDAYDDPTALNDLKVFSKQYGLPQPTSKNFEVTYQTKSKPQADPSGGWELEESLDIEYAHAMSPKAKIVLVEANSNSYSDLFAAEQVAAQIASAAGGGEVSNSYGGGEFSGEESYESDFTGANVVFFASTGDSPGVEVPSVLSNVVAVGGTVITRDKNNDFTGQTVWSSTGGGESAYVPIPSYQSVISKIVGSHRGVPDVSLVAGPPGVWIYDTTPYSGRTLDWVTVEGTSIASPATAAFINNVASFAASSPTELTTIYGDYTDKKEWTDITTGTCENGSSNLTGWDYCTGVGTPLGKKGK
jgi:subtilase family serine protease